MPSAISHLDLSTWSCFSLPCLCSRPFLFLEYLCSFYWNPTNPPKTDSNSISIKPSSNILMHLSFRWAHFYTLGHFPHHFLSFAFLYSNGNMRFFYVRANTMCIVIVSQESQVLKSDTNFRIFSLWKLNRFAGLYMTLHIVAEQTRMQSFLPSNSVSLPQN